MSDKGRGIRSLTLFLAAAAGFSNANIYYNQPLLGHMAHSYGESVNSVSFIPAATQLGFALGLVLLVPLGDTLDRRKLIRAGSRSRRSLVFTLSLGWKARIITGFPDNTASC
ncbi:permease [Paenibacillus elgii]|uniref:permease n=1 Tax=Paenibacillus elgii TaxID=189691 RepID=UPI000248DD1E|nr:permease [Paenibacillus elgii]